MSNIVLKFANDEQYEEFIEKIKQDVLKGIQPERKYSESWASVRDQMTDRFRKEYGDKHGQWHMTMTGLYGAFRIAFNRATIAELRYDDGERVQNFHDELFALIDRYRNGEDKK